jgi:hypothetical protein
MKHHAILKKAAAATAVLALGAIGYAAVDDGSTSPLRSEAPAPTIDSIKALTGDWYALDEEGEVTEQLVSSFRVTAGGHVVIETIFPGADEEMITVYHQAGDELVLTHYCMLGNEPHYVARPGDKAGDLRFECRRVDTRTSCHRPCRRSARHRTAGCRACSSASRRARRQPGGRR